MKISNEYYIKIANYYLKSFVFDNGKAEDVIIKPTSKWCYSPSTRILAEKTCQTLFDSGFKNVKIVLE